MKIKPLYSRSKSDGAVRPEGGAERGDLLGHLLHFGVAHASLVGVVQILDRVRAVQREDLKLRKCMKHVATFKTAPKKHATAKRDKTDTVPATRTV